MNIACVYFWAALELSTFRVWLNPAVVLLYC